jgi:c(7)-type cytochrome triheme protein
MKKGGDDITMAAMKDGKFCGGCHDGKTAFAATAAENCAKCHKK